MAPTFLAPGGKAAIIVSAINVGDAGVSSAGKPVKITDTLPPGLEASAISGQPAEEEVGAAQDMTCDLASVTCTAQAETTPAFEAFNVTIQVNVKSDAGVGEENKASVSGGEQEGQPGVEVAGASVTQPLSLSDEPTPFGVEAGGYAVAPEEEGGGSDTQAGSHPFQLTSVLDLNQSAQSTPEGLEPTAPALARNLQFNLPPGLIGDPLAVKACPLVDFLAFGHEDTNACGQESAIGAVVVTINEPNLFKYVTRTVPLWNLEPSEGEPARFGFEVLKVPVVLDTSVRTNGDYGVTASVSNAPQAAQLLDSVVTIWGVPGDTRHDNSRGWRCLDDGILEKLGHPCEPQREAVPPAFLTLPTSCDGPLATSVEGSSWPLKALGSEPGQTFTLAGANTESGVSAGLEGCAALPFDASIKVSSEKHEASTPTGMKVDVEVPQQSTLQGDKLAEADIDTTSVTLPSAVQLNPASADGLQACSEQQIGYEGAAAADPFAPAVAQPLRFSSEPAHCPQASKLGTVRVRTPLLAHELNGAVYLAAQEANPFDSLLALYVVAEDPFSGIRVKLAGEIELNQETGQITTKFVNTPQVPFEDFELELYGGPRAATATPPLCGGYPTSATFTPWSGEQPLTNASPAEEFAVTSGVGGGACPATQPFAPSLLAGSSSPQAGAFTSFTLQITRPDGNQALSGISIGLPPGAAAMLASVEPCQEPQAAVGECGPESEIGQATASAGVGSDPYTETGRVYITGPYNGAPFGLAIVTPAVAGPFNLGEVVVRSSINVNPNTAAVTIGGAIPTIIQGVGRPKSGIPLQLQHIFVRVDRPNFEFNPTNCNPMSIQGTLTGALGTTTNVSSPFQISGCASLPFAPKLTATAAGHGSKADGTSLDVTVTSAGLGQANIAKVDLQLPQALSSRLSTLQKACTEAVFNTNPASCSEDSVIGNATIDTPVLKNPLSGPAYLVSRGSAAFPDVEFVLQGEGITLLLDGKTDIKNGITYSRFESAPDAPFTIFDTTLPAGPHSVLTPNVPEKEDYSLCKASLAMPTQITAQNGAVINETTSITRTGCAKAPPKAATLTKAQQLAKALKACRKHKRKHKRLACEKQARKRYASKATAHKTTRLARGQGKRP